MTSPVPQNSNQAYSGRIWECLNAEAVTTSGSAADAIGLGDVVGVDIWQEPRNSQNPGLGNRGATRRQLVEKEVDGWLKASTGTIDQGGNRLVGKLLVGNQIGGGDFLRPEQDAVAARFSRVTLGQSLHLPPTTISKISSQGNWYHDFSNPSSSSSISCEGLGTATFNFAMSWDESGGTMFAILIFHPTIRQEAREALLDELEVLIYLSHEPAWVPYLIMNLFIRISSALLRMLGEAGKQTDEDIPKDDMQRQMASIFRQTHSRALVMGGIHRDTQNVLRLAKKWRGTVMKKPKAASQDNWVQTKTRKTELKNGFSYCIPLLREITDNASQAQEQTTRQLSTAINMLVYEQQKLMYEQQELSRQDQQTGIDIADASKVIAAETKKVAEETKKDGYSMKTLAVVTILFLPATSVSSVLSMPLFQWNEKNGKAIVNSKVWVYFIFAVPLTLITVGLWWVWQRRRIKGSSKLVSNC